VSNEDEIKHAISSYLHLSYHCYHKKKKIINHLNSVSLFIFNNLCSLVHQITNPILSPLNLNYYENTLIQETCSLKILINSKCNSFVICTGEKLFGVQIFPIIILLLYGYLCRIKSQQMKISQ
jgi:hypothetical protein